MDLHPRLERHEDMSSAFLPRLQTRSGAGRLLRSRVPTSCHLSGRYRELSRGVRDRAGCRHENRSIVTTICQVDLKRLDFFE